MFSRPVSSRWKPVPTSSSEPTRPRTRASPSVGSVIRERILSRVVLPAPLAPMTPIASPRCTSNETSRNAQSTRGSSTSPLRRSASRSVRKLWFDCPRRYCFPRPLTLIAESVTPRSLPVAPVGSRAVPTIAKDEIVLHPSSTGTDLDARLFEWNGELYRGVRPRFAPDYRALAESDLYARLVERGLAVAT